MLTTSAAARIADRPGAAHEQDRVLVDLELRIVDAVVIVLGPVEHDRPALEGIRVLRVGQDSGRGIPRRCTLVFMIASLNRLPFSTMKPASLLQRLVDTARMTSRIVRLACRGNSRPSSCR